MHSIRLYPSRVSLFLLCLMSVSALGCYARRKISPTRLPAIQKIEGLQFVLIDSERTSAMWLMSEPKFEQNALSAGIQRATEGFAMRISSLRKSADYRANQNLVLIYLQPSAVKPSADAADIHLDYASILRIEVFEPDAAKAIGWVFAGVGATAAVLMGVVVVVLLNTH